MTGTGNATDRFEERLLHSLLEHVHDGAAPGGVRAPRRRGRRRLAVSAAGLAAAGATAFAFSQSAASAAYAVDAHDGTVTVTVNSLRDSAGLQKALRDHGVPAVVDYAPEGKECRRPRGARPVGERSSRGSVSGTKTRSQDDASVTFGIDTGALAPGEWVVIESTVGASRVSLRMEFVQGPVSPCVLVAAGTQPPDKVVDTGADDAKKLEQGGAVRPATPVG